MGGQEEPGPHVRPGLQAPAEDRNLQEADRGGRGDRRPQPGQVPQGPAGVGGNLRARCPSRDVRSSVNIYLKKESQLTVFSANFNPRMAPSNAFNLKPPYCQ